MGSLHLNYIVIGYKQDSSSNEPNVPQSVAHLICVPQVPQMWHKMWHNSIYILSTNFTNGVQTCTRALIKHGEITALEDSIAAPQKVRYQYMAKK